MPHLVVTRKPGDKIIIGEGFNRVGDTLHELRLGKARIGIEANSQVPIVREELLARPIKEAVNGAE